MIAQPEKSPGYYAAEVFDHVSKLDPTFKDRYTPQSLFEKLQDKQYAADLYLWMSEQPEKFYDDVLFEEFVQKVKKKKSRSLRNLCRKMVRWSVYPLVTSTGTVLKACCQNTISLSNR